MSSNKKKILVTGGAGFIGFHLCDALLRRGDKVFSLDNYFTGSRDNHLPGAEYLKGQTADIERLIKFRPDLVYHLGEYARVEKSFEDLETVWKSNVRGTFQVLEFCRRRGVKIVYAGSSTKFGDGGLGRDQSPYAWTKATNSELVRNYGRWFNLPYAITYFYNVYGPRERNGGFGTLIAIFREKYLRGEPLPVVSPGSQRRNFTHVLDIVDGLIKVGERGQGDEYGFGSEESHSVLEVAKMFLSAPQGAPRQAGGGKIKMLPERKGNRMDSRLNISRAQNEFGWKATRRLEDYIAGIKKEKLEGSKKIIL